MVSTMRPDVAEIVESDVLNAGMSEEDRRALARALEFAASVYGEKLLGTGEPAYGHALGTARNVAALRLDADARAAGLLFAVPAYLPAAEGVLTESFGAAVASLVMGISRLNALRVITRTAARGKDSQSQAEVLRKMLLAMVEDIRVVLLRLASRTQTLRWLVNSPEAVRRELARETLDIYAPLANRLGVWQLKWELEDLSFRYLEPGLYKRIAGLFDDRRSERERAVERAIVALADELALAGIRAEISGRPKHLYSIYTKMRAKSLDFSQIHDVSGLRVLVDEAKDCYTVLGVVHNLWAPIPGEFDDYISRPKANLYRSLHTAVIGPEGKALEVRARPREMRRDEGRGGGVQLAGADLHFQGLTLRSDHRRVQRTVEVRFRPRDVVVEFPRDRSPQVMHDAEHRVAVLRLVHEHAQAAHVVDLREIERLRAHLRIDAVEVLRPAADLGPDSGERELVGERDDRPVDCALALAAAVVEQAGDALVEPGLEVAERQVFQLPLELPHAETIGERRVDVERLAGELAAHGFRRVHEPAQSLRAARKAQQHHADVLHHGEQHLAQHLGLRLRVLALRRAARDHAQRVEPADARDQRSDRRAERFLQLFLGPGKISGHGEEQPGGPRLGVEPERGDVARRPQGVPVSRLAGAEQFFAVDGPGKLERPGEHTPVLFGDSGVEYVGLDDFGEIRARSGHHARSLSHAVAPQSAVPDNPSFSRNLLMPDPLARQRTLSTLLLPTSRR